jgi:hypothetical protein
VSVFPALFFQDGPSSECDFDLQPAVARKYKEKVMAVHRFKVGQRVGLFPRNMQMPGAGEYKIMMLLPPTEGENQYRVKGSAEPFERVVKESDLIRR